MTYCSSLQPTVVYNFSKIESTFSVSFRDYVADCWWLRGMVSICLIRKREYYWFLHEYKGRLLYWLVLLLYLLQFVCCSKYSAKTTKFLYVKYISSFLTSVCPKIVQNFRYCTLMRTTFLCLLNSEVFHEGNLEENFINFVAFCLYARD